MKITKQIDKYNQFNIEDLTITRVLDIIYALEYCNDKVLLPRSAITLLESLKKQEHKLNLG